MPSLIILLFFLCGSLAFFEDRLSRTNVYVLFSLIGAALVLISGFRPIGIDPDSVNYANSYKNYSSGTIDSTVEPSFLFIISFFNRFTDDPQIVLIVYAILGVFLKCIAFSKLTPDALILSVTVYISYFFELHEMMQIRTGILSGCLLLAIPELVNKQRWRALGYILLGSFFHASGLILLSIFFLPTSGFSRLGKVFWAVFVVASLGFSFNEELILNIQSSIPYIGEKIEVYSKAMVLGASASTINPTGVFHLLSIVLFLGLLLFSDILTEKDNRFPLLLRVYGIGIMSYTVLGFLPDLGARVSALFQVVSIPLFVMFAPALKPKWVGVMAVVGVAFLYLNYGLQYLNFSLLWSTAG